MSSLFHFLHQCGCVCLSQPVRTEFLLDTYFSKLMRLLVLLVLIKLQPASINLCDSQYKNWKKCLIHYFLTIYQFLDCHHDFDNLLILGFWEIFMVNLDLFMIFWFYVPRYKKLLLRLIYIINSFSWILSCQKDAGQ